MSHPIECPWCGNQVVVFDGVCPECKQEVLPEHIDGSAAELGGEIIDRPDHPIDLSLEEAISNKFKCVKCKHKECNVKEIAVTGTGFSKLFDIQHNHYLLVSCTHCGYVEVYDPDILRGKKAGGLGTILDVLFGG